MQFLIIVFNVVDALCKLCSILTVIDKVSKALTKLVKSSIYQPSCLGKYYESIVKTRLTSIFETNFSHQKQKVPPLKHKDPGKSKGRRVYTWCQTSNCLKNEGTWEEYTSSHSQSTDPQMACKWKVNENNKLHLVQSILKGWKACYYQECFIEAILARLIRAHTPHAQLPTLKNSTTKMS